MRRLWLCSIGKRGANRHNDEIRMTKLEGMTNEQMTNHRDVASWSFGLCASFVICHSPAAL